MVLSATGLAALSAALGVGGVAYAGNQSAKAVNNAKKITNSAFDSNNREIQADLNNQYTNRSEFQEVARQMRSQSQEAYRRMSRTQAITGYNPSAMAIQQQGNATQHAQMWSNIGGNASAVKQGYKQALQNNRMNQAQYNANMDMQKAQMIAQAGSQVGNTVANVLANVYKPLG